MNQHSASSAGVEELILRRLDDSAPGGLADDLIVAALLGEDELAAAINTGGETAERPEPAQAGPTPEAKVAFLKSIAVAGFRGIGPEAVLRLNPGPGLTVVAGRNGSGKSSFAEAAELALTGENMRWKERSAIWRAGWRNLHDDSTTRICAELAVDGEPGVTKVIRQWPAGADLDDAASSAQRHGGASQPLGSLGWEPPLRLYRPFLSYAELGALVGGRPTEMHDAVQAILGLEPLIDAERRLTEARKQADTESKRAKDDLPALLELLAGHQDQRARLAEDALRPRSPDLAEIDALTAGAGPADDEVITRLKLITTITLPAEDTAGQEIAALAAAKDRAAGMAGSAAADARRLASLLSGALDHYGDHPGESCPVCGGRRLDPLWAGDTRAEITRLSELAKDADRAEEGLLSATRAVRSMIGPQPNFLHQGVDLEGLVSTAAARDAWQAWAGRAADGDAARLIAEAGARFGELDAAAGRLREDADRVLRERGEAWQPAAAALARWAGLARSGQRATVNLAALKKALAWLREIGHDIRNARLAPLAGKSAMVWEMLRQESNVELGPIRLEGTSSLRRVAMDVTVDGIGGAALSVMSQGELHALGLALFLPRATAEESPFRFIVIDDPVQSMDPAKVDGLARLLAWVAADRQVIVFTHDDRLPEAIRRLQLPATLWEVTRRERSVVRRAEKERGPGAALPR